jgi:hypothetical protein
MATRPVGPENPLDLGQHDLDVGRVEQFEREAHERSVESRREIGEGPGVTLLDMHLSLVGGEPLAREAEHSRRRIERAYQPVGPDGPSEPDERATGPGADLQQALAGPGVQQIESPLSRVVLRGIRNEVVGGADPVIARGRWSVRRPGHRALTLQDAAAALARAANPEDG